MLTITIDTARRFILGKQGLWPGRRWRGIEGTEQAIHAMEYLQLDPLHVIARSQDIQLHSRILDYTPGMWEDLAYQQHQFFDWGGWLAVRPMDELPDFRVVMRRERDGDSGDPLIRGMAAEHAEAIEEMRAGKTRVEAILESGHKRARPIVMTTVAMVAGMLPVAAGWGGDSDFRGPMAIAVIGGLITSTALTLVIVPAVFTVLDDIERWIAPKAGRLLAESPAPAASGAEPVV